MSESEHNLIQALILKLLPEDHTFLSNKKLLQNVRELGGVAVTDSEFQAARESLLAEGKIVKGRGPGGSTAHATGDVRPDFDLKAEIVTPDMLIAKPNSKSPASGKAKAVDASTGDPQVLSYRHPDRRKNNPEVGLVNEASDPEQAKTPWEYDPHLDPALHFDSARSVAEKLIEDALAGDDPTAMRHALEELRRMSAPYLQWTGKSERTSFEVDTVSLHVHERIDAMSILSAVSKRQGKKDDKAATAGFQPGLFEAPFESLPLRSAVDFYKHDRGWANRLVAGDSLLVMNSLLQKEGMAGQVQMIYIDPPYGIKYGSNFQPFTNKRDVKDRSDADLSRLVPSGNTSRFVWFYDDFPLSSYGTVWDDTVRSGFGDAQVYVVETNALVVERCMLMTTAPGDLVLDPTCGSGTTAYAAEKWGRRWITCDTSRVAITLAKQRLMTGSFDYYTLRYPHERLRGGFIYKTVPHVTLKDIANNADIDSIYERLHPRIDASLAALNSALNNAHLKFEFTVANGVRKGQKLVTSGNEIELIEWEVPFDYPTDWPSEAKPLFSAFHTARQKMQTEIDRSIAAQANNETLYDQPEKTKNKLRITGPFTVEAVPFPTVLSLEAHSAQAPQGQEAPVADMSVARSGSTSRQHAWRDELLKAGIRGKGGQMLKFAELEVLPGTTCLHATGHLDTGERIVISFGPEHGALEQRQVEHALNEAGELFPRPKMIVFCAFAFDPEAASSARCLCPLRRVPIIR